MLKLEICLKIAANNLHIAFKIQSLEIMDYIERIYVQVVERLNYKKSLANGDRYYHACI